MNYEDDFINGLKVIAGQRFWRRECWSIEDPDEVLSLLCCFAAPRWENSELPQSQEARRQYAARIGHRVRRQVVRNLNRFNRRKGIY